MSYSKMKSLAAYIGAVAAAGINNSLYTLPKRSTRSYYEEKYGMELAKAKKLQLYTFGTNQDGDSNWLYAKNEKEAIKRALKRGYDINLMKHETI